MARILIIDDEEQIRQYLQRILEKEGHEVVDAPDGAVGTKLYREKPADVVILDILMPEKEGLETIIELKRDYPDTKIIAISGGGRGGKLDFLKIAQKLGALRTLNKPFTRKEIINTVQELLDV
jgi:YesN/AraC family two-component response regulator